MAYDPNKPADNTLATAAEMRDQLNALKALNDAKPSMDQVNDAIAAALSGPPAPQLSFDTAAGLWHIVWAGPSPAQWQEWKRCDYLLDWTVQGTVDIPGSTEGILAGDELWYQIKVVGLNDSDIPVTPFSNVVNSPLAILASNPPTQVEVQTIINTLNDLLATVKR